ncbi:hypothetical protein [Streptomyces sp. RK75]|uniref:hypothetical protein n=1 Tax=Streptomyces sp. RK75 TaxID=2824895 RepID=UPI001B393A63|nr:hypothetical protein [Streptomyces sp. RK75]MBQ0868034.1 hypothetical protein [Streptomyces sp. RK75]
MTKLLLSLHVLAAILAVGPIAVAASMFPRFARDLPAAGAGAGDGAGDGDGAGAGAGVGAGSDVGAGKGRGAAAAALLHRICRGYALFGVAVPVFGMATGAQLGVLSDAWLVASLILTTLAAVLLGAVVLPRQARMLGAAGIGLDEGEAVPVIPDPRAAAAQLAMVTGIFNLLWAIVVVLMIVRPGSTTGA